MKSGKGSTAVTHHYSPYEHIRDDFSHEASILDNVTGVFNVGSPSVIRIGYGKKSKNNFRDPIMKCLWILELSEKYFHKKLNIAKFATSRDTMINAHFLALPTILALQSSHNMRFEEQSKLPGNHVTCYWQGQIIDYEYKRSYPLTLDNLHFTCGETLQFEGIALGYSIIPKTTHDVSQTLAKSTDAEII